MMYLSLKCFFLATFVFSNGFGKSALFTTDSFDMNVDEIACCKEKYVLSCHHISVNAENLGTQYLHLTSSLNETVEFQGMVGDSDHSYHYQNEKIDMVMTYNAARGSLHGHATDDSNGASYVIEYCRNNGSYIHVLKQMDVDNMAEDSMPDQNTDVADMNYDDIEDMTSIVTFTVKVYYTPQFKAATADIDGWLDQVIEETNQGYINSKVPLRVKLFCHEEAPVNDGNNALNDFSKIKGGDFKAILGSVDQAALLLKNYRACGTAWGINMVPSGRMISVTKKSCALGYYSFGHELAHNIGLAHNKETGHYNRHFSYGQANLIKRGKASTGYRTILGYNYAGHRERVNYYSNPDVIYPRTGTPTGTSRANNAKVLTLQRFKLADIGDESDYQCSGAPPVTTAPPATTIDCSNEGTRVDRWKYVYAGQKSDSGCAAACSSDNDCVGWTNGYGKWCYKLNAIKVQDPGYVSGPDESKPECNLYPSDKCNLKQLLIRYPSSMGYKETDSANDCHAACSDNKDCVAWKYWKEIQRCYMYKANFIRYNRKRDSSARHCLGN